MSDEHKRKTADMIAVMQAYVDGKPIECRPFNAAVSIMKTTPVWNWDDYDYRIATIPDSINWDHVSPEWKYMARDDFGDVWLFKTEPFATDRRRWDTRGGSVLCIQFASYVRGTVDWKDSLVRRPS